MNAAIYRIATILMETEVQPIAYQITVKCSNNYFPIGFFTFIMVFPERIVVLGP